MSQHIKKKKPKTKAQRARMVAKRRKTKKARGRK